jgi:hypothetical protein
VLRLVVVGIAVQICVDDADAVPSIFLPCLE